MVIPCRFKNLGTPGACGPERRLGRIGRIKRVANPEGLRSYNQVQGRSQRLVAWLPAGRAHFAVVGGDVLSSLNLTDQVLGRAADAQVVNFNNLDQTFWVDYEG